MRKRSIITILLLFLTLMSTTAFAEESVKTQESINATIQTTPKQISKITIIPYINSTEEKKGYIQEVIDSKYTEQYSDKNFQITPVIETQKALNDAGYDISNMELPDKDILSSIAKKTNANYVIAMEISQLTTTRHLSFFQTKVVTKAKLRYKFYNAEQDKVVSFQTVGLSENKSTFGDVGYKNPITNALNQAMEDANEKIMSNL